MCRKSSCELLGCEFKYELLRHQLFVCFWFRRALTCVFFFETSTLTCVEPQNLHVVTGPFGLFLDDHRMHFDR
jgi:hypothetical protein